MIMPLLLDVTQGSKFDRDRPMTETAPLAAAHQAIGAYFCEFSLVEQELGESVKVVYGLQSHEASDAIIAALGDFARKASMVLAASKGAKNADGKMEAAADWKDKVETTITRVFKCNNDRVLLAHSLLQPNADGSVDLVRLKITGGEVTGRDGVKWSRNDFVAKIGRLKEVAKELKSLNDELRAFKYTIPNLGWVSISNFEPTMGMMRPQGISAVLRDFGSQPLPPTPPETPKK
jgi:hypothetical protein